MLEGAFIVYDGSQQLEDGTSPTIAGGWSTGGQYTAATGINGGAAAAIETGEGRPGALSRRCSPVGQRAPAALAACVRTTLFVTALHHRGPTQACSPATSAATPTAPTSPSCRSTRLRPTAPVSQAAQHEGGGICWALHVGRAPQFSCPSSLVCCGSRERACPCPPLLPTPSTHTPGPPPTPPAAATSKRYCEVGGVDEFTVYW
jgi:hypothetical protein